MLCGFLIGFVCLKGVQKENGQTYQTPKSQYKVLTVQIQRLALAHIFKHLKYNQNIQV